MEDSFDHFAVLEKYSRIPITRISYLAEANESVVSRITCGVLFIAAFWSGPSLQAFHELTKVLSTLDPEGRLELVVVDIDGCQETLCRTVFHGHVSGAGETAWVKNGRIVSTSFQGFNSECFTPNTTMLLSTI